MSSRAETQVFLDLWPVLQHRMQEKEERDDITKPCERALLPRM
jgi:hypothetical protein